MKARQAEKTKATPAPLDGFLAANEVCALIGFSRITLWRLTRDGRFPIRVVTSPGRIGYRRSEVERWLADPSKFGIRARKGRRGNDATASEVEAGARGA